METFQTVSYDKTIECRQQYGSHLVKIQRVRINIVKCPFLALDRFLQVAHSLRILDPNRKDTLCRFAKDPAIELKGSRHDDCKEIRSSPWARFKHGHVITRDEPNPKVQLRLPVADVVGQHLASLQLLRIHIYVVNFSIYTTIIPE
jgi:hypothetical protein